MARKTTKTSCRKRRKKAQGRREGAQAGKAAKPSPPRRRPRPIARPLHGDMPPWTHGRGRRKRSAASRPPMPEPKGELQHVNPFTLLVAVVLSAQATDAGVNKATPALFALADTPEKMVSARRGQGARADQDHRALPHQGEERHRAVGEADRRARRRGAARRARRWRRCPASAARPPTSCSTSPSASRPSRSTRTSSASATAPGSRPARTRSRSS